MKYSLVRIGRVATILLCGFSSFFDSSATSKLTKPAENWMPDACSYGYFWHQTEITAGDKRYAANLAWGGGWQYIIIETLELIAVITGHDREDRIFPQVSKSILPAFVE